MESNIKDIKHQGVIRKITDDFYFVAVERTAACQGYAAKGFCNINADKNELIPIQRLPHQNFCEGDTVTLSISEKTGWKALFFGYIMPFLALIAGIIIAAIVGLSQGITGLVGIGALVVYYVVFNFFSKRIDKQFSFRIV
jgi:sigma-E factor negative regulatory protein RseC